MKSVLAYAAAAAAALLAGIAALAAIPDDYPNRPLLLQLLALLLAAAVAAGMHWRARLRHPGWALVLALAVALALGVYAALEGTPFGLNGFAHDAWFCSAAVTKFATTWRLCDFAYPELPAFYPPLYFWVLGKLAMLSSAPAFFMWKHALIAGAFLLPIATFALYARILGAKAALVHVFLLFLAWNEVFLYKPHSFIAYVLFVWWTHALAAVRQLDAKTIASGGIAGAIVVQTYYYPCFILAVACAIVVARFALARDWPGLRGCLPALAPLAAALVLSSPFWLPLVIASAGPGTEALSNRWFERDHVDFWLPLRSVVAVEDLLLVFGLGFLVLCHDRRAAFAKALLVACYVWYAVGYAGMIGFDTPLLHLRTDDIVPLLILPYAAQALVSAHAAAVERFGAAAHAVAVLLAALGVAHATRTYFDGVLASPLYKAIAQERWVDDPVLAARIERELTGDALLAGIDGQKLVAQFPIAVFIAQSAFYSHPASRFSERLAFLHELERAPTAAEFARRLAHNPFARVGHVLLHRAEGTQHGRLQGHYAMVLWTSGYPQGGKAVTLYFRPGLFDSDHLEKVPFPLGELFRVKPGA